MKFKSHILIVLIALSLLFGFSTATALEIDVITSPEATVEAADRGEAITEYIVRLYWFAVGAAGVVAVTVIVGGAIYYMVSSGSPDKQNDAKSYITSALWGVALLLGSYLILNTINPQITTLRGPTGGLSDCTGLSGENPGVDCLPRPALPSCTGETDEVPGETCQPSGCEQGQSGLTFEQKDPACQREIAAACTNVWRECEVIYPEKPGFRATFNEKVRGPFFNCTDEDSCEEDIEVQLVEVEPDENSEVTLVAYPFYKLFGSDREPDKEVVRVRCAATYAFLENEPDEPFVPKDVSLVEKGVTGFLNFFTGGSQADVTKTLSSCQSPQYYINRRLLPGATTTPSTSS